MAFEVIEEEETEDHYVVTLAFRPQGEYTGDSGREQFFIEKEGGVAHRQVLELPKPAETKGKFPVALVGGVLVVAVAVVAVVIVVISGALGESDESPSVPAVEPVPPVPPVPPQPPVQAQTFPTPAVAATQPVETSTPVQQSGTPTPSAPTPGSATQPTPEPATQPTLVPAIQVAAPTVVQTSTLPAPTATAAPLIQSQEPVFELARAEIPKFGFAFDYASEWDVVTHSDNEFVATTPGEDIAVLAEGQEFDGTLDQLAEEFLATLDSFLNELEIVNRSDRVLRLGNLESGDSARGILIEFTFRDDDNRPSMGRALLGTRMVDGVGVGFLLQYMAVKPRADVAQRLFSVALNSLELSYPDIVQAVQQRPVFSGEVYSAWSDTSAFTEIQLYEEDGTLYGYIYIEPPHTGSGDLEGEIDGNQVLFGVTFVEEDVEFNCVYEGILSGGGNGVRGEYICANSLVGMVDQGSWEVSK